MIESFSYKNYLDHIKFHTLFLIDILLIINIIFDIGTLMNQLLMWQLSENITIRFYCEKNNLSNITCCDTISIVGQYHNQSFTLAQDLRGCNIEQLQKNLQKITFAANQPAQALSVSFSNFCIFSLDQCSNILVTLLIHDTVWCYQIIPLQTIQAWTTQLELLHVLMEENEKEQQSRNKPCC